MKKIGFLVPEIINCGPVNMVFNIIQCIDCEMFSVMLISVRKTKTNSDYVNNIRSKCKLGVFDLEIFSLQDLVLNLDVIHSHGYYPDKIVAGLKNDSVKKITTIHCQFFKDYLQEYGKIKGFFGALLHFYYLNTGKFDYHVGCSQSVKEYLDSYLLKRNKKKVLSINNGVDQNIFFPLNQREKTARRKKLGFCEKDKIFIYAGRLIRRKRVPELITFFNEKAIENSILLILGTGNELAECEAIATKKMIFLGYQENPQKYYQISDFVLSMSSAEGYPMSILEAVSCGCYAFLSDIPSHQEFINLNPYKADVIDNLTEDKLCVKNNNNNNHNLSAQKMTEQYVKLYLG
ncbi:glycosyltransferase [Capnocytophaga canis]|uniref:Glycosyltransferase, group 1 family protein n=1 Tax=Capnocytophaga canis TaxID=1848903 RepID=A0A0B7IVK1_9FLAO|nr:glycosyltransferase [Capnocytophaga canis]CEN53978.1 Glycosyltransferase, group 1 family protein [Capnocytophaga canis]